MEEAVARTGEDDFGEPSWQEGLALLLDSLEQEARLNDLGVEIATAEVVAYLANRLAITAWRRDHPEVAEGTIERPIFIVGPTPDRHHHPLRPAGPGPGPCGPR